jgi:hypothetical protein
MTNPNTVNSFEADVHTVKEAAHKQRGIITTRRDMTVDRWDLEDLVAASSRLSESAEKYHRVAAILENLLPRLEEVCFSDIAISENIAALQELSSGDAEQSDEQPSL